MLKSTLYILLLLVTALSYCGTLKAQRLELFGGVSRLTIPGSASELKTRTGVAFGFSIDAISAKTPGPRLALSMNSSYGQHRYFRSSIRSDFSRHDLVLQAYPAGVKLFEVIEINLGIEGRVTISRRVTVNSVGSPEPAPDYLQLKDKFTAGVCGRIAIPLRLSPRLSLIGAYGVSALLLPEWSPWFDPPTFRHSGTLGLIVKLDRTTSTTQNNGSL